MTILGKEFGFLARGRARAGNKVGQARGEHVLDVLFASVGVSHDELVDEGFVRVITCQRDRRAEAFQEQFHVIRITEGI